MHRRFLYKQLAKRILTAAAPFILLPALCGCAQREIIELPAAADYIEPAAAERMHLRIGVTKGPYGDMFKKAIYPSLEEMGYTAEFRDYDDADLPNYALDNNQIDLNIFQHYRFLVHEKVDAGFRFSAIAETPTLPMGIYSLKYDSLAELPYGAAVHLPEDVTNYARALLVLEDAGLIKLSRSVDSSEATKDDIVLNPLNLKINTLKSRNLVTSLHICDIAVIDGDYAVVGGLSPSAALFTEWLVPAYFNVIAVRTEDLTQQFVEDIISVIRSDAYRDIITDPENGFSEFQKPFNFYRNT